MLISTKLKAVWTEFAIIVYGQTKGTVHECFSQGHVQCTSVILPFNDVDLF